jgi:ubiquinone/menaquinone biosynthesis C-methylase UbiE
MAPLEVSSSQNESEKATVYDKLRDILSLRTVDKCCTYLKPHIKPTYRILDVGCGPGSITAGLARLVPQGHVVGVDILSDYLDQARHLAEAQGVKNIEFIQSDAHAIKALSDESFDIVHSHQVLLHLSDPVGALREMRRLVKPGGIVAAKDNAINVSVPTNAVIEKQVEIYERIARDRGAHTDGGRHTPAWAHEAGFAWDKIEMSSAAWEYSGPEGRRIWIEGAKDTLRKVAMAGGYATEEEMDEARAAWEEWATHEEARFMALDGQIICSK